MNPSKNYKWIEMREVPTPPDRKTKIWNVTIKEGGAILGEIKWFARWRCYGFFPATGTIYECNCLWDIADFCANQTTEHKARQKLSKTFRSDAGVSGDVESRHVALTNASGETRW
jgi:hypothetical protein